LTLISGLKHANINLFSMISLVQIRLVLCPFRMVVGVLRLVHVDW
jgi:hypothetical protein